MTASARHSGRGGCRRSRGMAMRSRRGGACATSCRRGGCRIPTRSRAQAADTSGGGASSLLPLPRLTARAITRWWSRSARPAIRSAIRSLSTAREDGRAPSAARTAGRVVAGHSPRDSRPRPASPLLAANGVSSADNDPKKFEADFAVLRGGLARGTGPRAGRSKGVIFLLRLPLKLRPEPRDALGHTPRFE